jgi:catechol-2,3-dioxygenase
VRIDRVSDHAVGWGVYFFDPDGNRLELFCNRENNSASEAQAVFIAEGAPSRTIPIERVGAS